MASSLRCSMQPCIFLNRALLDAGTDTTSHHGVLPLTGPSKVTRFGLAQWRVHKATAEFSERADIFQSRRMDWGSAGVLCIVRRGVRSQSTTAGKPRTSVQLRAFTSRSTDGASTSNPAPRHASSAPNHPVQPAQGSAQRKVPDGHSNTVLRPQKDAFTTRSGKPLMDELGGTVPADEEDVLDAWRSEILGESTKAGGSAATNRGVQSVSTPGESGAMGGGGASGDEGSGKRETRENVAGVSGVQSGGSDASDAFQRKTALAARLLGLNDPADISVPSGPPAREVLAGLKNPPWKAEGSSSGESGSAEGEGPVLSEGDRWRQERLQQYLENKARVQASRAAESSGRGVAAYPRKDMGRVRKSRGMEGPGLERKHSRPGYIPLARAAMFTQFNSEVHEAIKQAVGAGEGRAEVEEEARSQAAESGLAEPKAEDGASIEAEEQGSSAFEKAGASEGSETVVSEEQVAAMGPNLLKSALAAGSVSELQELIRAHEEATSDVLDADTGSMLVRELSWARRPELAEAVFRTLCAVGNEPSARACAALVAAAHRSEDFRMTLRVFSAARVREIVPDRATCMAALAACHRLGRWREAKAIFSDMLRTGLEPDTLAYNALLMVLGGQRQAAEVQAVWVSMQARGVRPNSQTYGLLISTFTKAELAENALEIYERLTKEGLQPSALMYEGLVVLLCRNKRDRMALNFYQEMRLAGCVLRARGCAVLLSALAKGWVLDWESALEVYTNMKSDKVQLDVHHMTALLKVLALSRQTEAALETWKEFLAAGVAPDRACYNSVIGVLRVVHDYDRAMDFFWEMKDRGIPPDQETYGNLLWACSEPGLYKTALKLFEDMKAGGVPPNTHAFTALFTVMGRAGEWQTALELWKEMRALGIKPSTKTYNAMIGSLGRCRKPDLMLKAHRQMLDEGVRPDDTTRHFLGKFGPPGTNQNPNPWGAGNLLGQRVELKHYARGNEPRVEVPSDSSPVYTPGEAYRRGGVLHAIKREDPGWVRPTEERKVAAELRKIEKERARARGEAGWSDTEESGGVETGGVAGRENEDADEWQEDEYEWVSEDDEELEEAGNEGPGYDWKRRGVEKGEREFGGKKERQAKAKTVRRDGRSTRTSEQGGSIQKGTVVRDGLPVVEVESGAAVENPGMADSRTKAVSKKKGKRGKDKSEDESVPLWQLI
ncbi:putative Pentatricopeptide repeat domain containing protein [Klebsormidium nitens]|uniref:Putative Pentatricopeptide repeat domain containing protein n=1 Tax=Klebsormidium nitens TaxID=105231 RepID=A0A1Y1IUH3_KLENI|nr:putative Pentatricopeptide repeat domain containing protein [Klebsormidium nitens]|eukprot:GAQ93259.1 putative Pentatricopeptide repeat domain containing protein [Klebsormidium nitens]